MDQPAPEAWQPPLRWYSHLWRDAAVVVLGLLLWLPAAEAQAGEYLPVLFWVDVAGGVVAFVLAHWRRRWPMTIAVLTLVLFPVSLLSGGPAALTSVSVATHRVRWQVAVLAVLNFGTGLAYYYVQPAQSAEPFWINLLVTVAATAAIIGWGMFIGSRRELVWTLRQRAEAAEAERDLRADRARSHERARIAREMHDVLAHRISQISMHAGALSYRDDLDADGMRSSAAVIREKAHEALTDLRDVLGVLRDEQGDRTGPQPRFGDVATLIEESRASGMTIDDDVRLPDDSSPTEAVGRTTYRIVQEGITNAGKHAPGSRLRIEVVGSPEAGLTITMRNPLGFATDTPGARLGLVGLTERAALRGGHLDHHVASTPEGSVFVVHAWLPWST